MNRVNKILNSCPVFKCCSLCGFVFKIILSVCIGSAPVLLCASCTQPETDDLKSILASIPMTTEDIVKISSVFELDPDDAVKKLGFDLKDNIVENSITSTVYRPTFQLDTDENYKGKSCYVIVEAVERPAYSGDWNVLDIWCVCVFDKNNRDIAGIVKEMYAKALELYGEPVTVHFSDNDSFTANDPEQIIDSNDCKLLKEYWDINESLSVELQFDTCFEDNYINFIIHSFAYPIDLDLSDG